jgi:hypothetical protein
MVTKQRGAKSQANLKKGGGPGRGGRPPKAARDMALRMLSDPKYRKTVQEKLNACTLHPSVHALLLQYAYGRPTEKIELEQSTAGQFVMKHVYKILSATECPHCGRPLPSEAYYEKDTNEIDDVDRENVARMDYMNDVEDRGRGLPTRPPLFAAPQQQQHDRRSPLSRALPISDGDPDMPTVSSEDRALFEASLQKMKGRK